MKRRLVFVLVLVGVSGAVVGRSAATPVTYGRQVGETPLGVAALTSSSSQVLSVSCGAAGACAAGGLNLNAADHRQSFVVSETSGVWGDALALPAAAALNNGGEVSSVSCVAAGTCTTGGFYVDGSGNEQAIVVSETSGVWGDGSEVPGTAALNNGGYAFVQTVSCASAGNCAAGGAYNDTPNSRQAFLVSETNGVWSNAIEVPGTAALNTHGDAITVSVSCSAARDCSAGGYYTDGSGHLQTFVVSETNGVWGDAIEVPGTAALSNGNGAYVSSVSCGAVGDCAVGGFYYDETFHQHAYVASETNGVWGDAIEVPGSGADADVTSVSCVAAGVCTAGGISANHAFVVSETNGVWGEAINVPGSGPGGNVTSVSCVTAEDCAAGGYYTDGSGHFQAFVVSETNGVWGDAIEVPGTGALNSGGQAFVSSVSCATAGSCAAGGMYLVSGLYHGFVVNETSGVWGDAIQVPALAPVGYSVAYEGNGATGGTAPSDASSPYTYGSIVTVIGPGSLTRKGHSFDGWNTAANGRGTAYKPGQTFPMPASAVTLYAQWAARLHAGTTTCKGTYSGTGRVVVVPAFATCTLISGTHVTGNVTVKPRGTLHISGVTISGKLTTSGSATVCGSKIGGSVVATGDSFALGGPACAGNTITSGNVLVTNDSNNVWIWNNTVKNGHTLTVKYGAGATDSIVGNKVAGKLLVAYSGPPVEVRANHAATALCTNNKGQTGSGNVASGTNTCPH